MYTHSLSVESTWCGLEKELWLTQMESLPSLVVGHEDGPLGGLTTHQRLNAIRNRVKLKMKAIAVITHTFTKLIYTQHTYTHCLPDDKY